MMRWLCIVVAIFLSGCVDNPLGEFADDPPCLYLYSIAKNEPQHPPSATPGRLPGGGTPGGGGLVVFNEIHGIGDGRPSYVLSMSPLGWRFMKLGESEFNCVIAEGYEAAAFPERIPNGGRPCYLTAAGCYQP